MKVTIIGIGKTKQNFVDDGIAFFKKRIGRFADFKIEILPDIKNAAKLSSELLKQAEGQVLLKRLENQTFYILDEKGKQFSSIKFADFIEKETVSGNSNLIFCIGGAYGFSNDVKQKAKLAISLSAGTFTHQFIRLMFTEQIYRALSIINNLPYHNE